MWLDVELGGLFARDAWEGSVCLTVSSSTRGHAG